MARAITREPSAGSRGDAAAPAGRTTPSAAASSVLALQQAAGNAAVGRVLARRPVTVRLATPPPIRRRTWAERASYHSRERAARLDELEKLSDADIKKLRDEVTAKASGPEGTDQAAATRRLEDIETVTTDRGIAPRAERYGRYDGPVAKRMNVRAHLEQDVRDTRSFNQALKAFSTYSGIEEDIKLFKKERDAFASDFKGQAYSVCERMLDASQIGIKQIVEAYGLPYDSVKLAARELGEGRSSVEEQADHIIAVVVNDPASHVDDPKYEGQREALAKKAGELDKLKAAAHDLKVAANKAGNAMSAGSDPKSVASQEDYRKAQTAYINAYNELAMAWIAAERLHPVLTGFRGRTAIEDVDLSGVDTRDPRAEMKAVLMEVLPKFRDLAKARWQLQHGGLKPMTLPTVVALTRTLLFIPKGSLRDGIVNDLAAEAADDGDSTFIKIFGFALAILAIIPTAGASLGIAAGMAAVTLATYQATKEWEKYSKAKLYANTDVDWARALSTEDPSLTGFAFSLVNLGLEAIPLAGAFNKARRLRAAVAAGEDTAELVKDINRIGANAPIRANANPHLGDEVLADIKKTTRAPEVEVKKPVSGGGSPPSAAKPRTEEELAGSSAKKAKPGARPVNYKPPGAKGGAALPSVPVVDTTNTLAKFANHQSVDALRASVGPRLAKLTNGRGKLNPMMTDIMDRLGGIPKTAGNRELIQRFPTIYNRTREPKFVEDAMAALWEEAAKGQRTTREVLAAKYGGEAGLPKLLHTLDDDAEEFRQLLLNEHPFLDAAFASDYHGAHIHLFQEFLVDRAGGPGTGRLLRKLIAESTGPEFVPTGGRGARKWWGAFWDAMFDDPNGRGYINHPESLGQILQEDLGLPRY